MQTAEQMARPPLEDSRKPGSLRLTPAALRGRPARFLPSLPAPATQDSGARHTYPGQEIPHPVLIVFLSDLWDNPILLTDCSLLRTQPWSFVL